MNIEKQISLFNDLKDQILVFKGIDLSRASQSKLKSLVERLVKIEKKIKAQQVLSNFINDTSSINSVSHLTDDLKKFERLQQTYISVIENLSEIYEKSIKKNTGVFRQNILLTKIRKLYLAMEQRRLPSAAELNDLKENLSEIEKTAGENFQKILRDLSKMNKDLTVTQNNIISTKLETRKTKEKTSKFKALINHVANNGDDDLYDEKQSAKNFIRLSKKLVMEHKPSV